MRAPTASSQVLRGLVPMGLVDFLAHRVRLLEREGRMGHDRQVLGAPVAYGDQVFDTLLDQLTRTVAGAVGRSVVPTYSFVRVYRGGDELVPHTDRAACEHSLSIQIESDSSADPWPLWLRDGHDEPIGIAQEVGDAVLYHGMNTLHWRDRYEGGRHVQAFLHYVSTSGPHSHLAWDGREGPGCPGVSW